MYEGLMSRINPSPRYQHHHNPPDLEIPLDGPYFMFISTIRSTSVLTYVFCLSELFTCV